MITLLLYGYFMDTLTNKINVNYYSYENIIYDHSKEYFIYYFMDTLTDKINMNYYSYKNKVKDSRR